MTWFRRVSRAAMVRAASGGPNPEELAAEFGTNPVTEVVNGGRQLFAGHLWNGTVALAVILPGCPGRRGPRPGRTALLASR